MKKIGDYYIPTKLSDLTEEQKQKLFNWIDERIIEKQHICYSRTAYGLKHIFKRDTGIYITTWVFKEAMINKGFKAKQISKENWCFNIKFKKE